MNTSQQDTPTSDSQDTNEGFYGSSDKPVISREELFKIIEPAIFNKDDKTYTDRALERLTSLFMQREREARLDEIQKAIKHGVTVNAGMTGFRYYLEDRLKELSTKSVDGKQGGNDVRL